MYPEPRGWFDRILMRESPYERRADKIITDAALENARENLLVRAEDKNGTPPVAVIADLITYPVGAAIVGLIIEGNCG